MFSLYNLFVPCSISYIVFSITFTVLISILILYILKPRSISNFIERVGWRTRVTVTEQSDPPKTSVKENSSKNSKPQQKTKKSEPPVFKTKLSTPVENAIAESIKDVKCKSPQPSTSKKKEIPKTSVTKQQDEKIKATQNKEKKENSNNSAKPTETKSEKSTKKIAKKDDTPQVSKTSKTEKSADDKVPFSPVKEKGKGKKKSTEDTKETKSTSSTVIEQTKKTKEDLSKPSIKKETTQAPEKSTEGTKETKSTSSTVIEQTKKTKQDLSKPSIKKETTQAPEKSTEGTKETKSTSSTVIEQTKKTKEDLSKPSIKKETTQAPEKVQVASTKSKQSPVNPPVEKSQVSKSKTDLKESKIVSSSISYANVVTNKVPEINGNAVNLKIEGKVVDSNLNSVKNKEQTKSEDINQKVQGFEKSDTQTKVVTELPSTTDLDVNSCSESEKLGSLTLDPKIPDLEKSFDPVENLSQQSYPGNLSSKSSSIEVIGEEQNVDSLNTSENHPENLDSFRQSEAPKQFETIKRDLLDLNSNLSSQTTSIYVPKSDEEKFKENKLESNGNKEAFTSVPTITASEKKETKESPENQSDFEESQLKALEELIEKESPLIQQSKPQEVIKVESSLVDNAAPFSNQEIKLEEFEVVEPVIQKSVAYLTYDNPETEIKENISSEAANANVTKEPQLLEDTEPELNLDEVAAKIELLLVPETEETRVSSSVEVSNDHFIEKPEGLESIVAEKVGSTQKIEIDSQKTEKLEESLEEKVEPKPQHLESVEGLTEERKESLLNLENKVKTEKDQVETDRLQLDEIKDSIVEREFLPSDISQEIEEKSEELGLTEKLVEEETETKPLFIPTEEIKISENSPFEVFSISTPQNLEEIEESTEERKESVTSLRTQENTQNYSFELSDTEAPLETQDLVEEKLQASLTHKTEDIVIDNIKYSYEIYTFNNPESENQQESVFFKETDCLRSDINDINNFFGNEENRSKEISINSSTAGVLGDTSENSFGNEENTSKEISANSSAAEVLEESSENFFGNEENKSKEISTNSSTAETLEETSEDFLGNEKNKSKEISTNSSTAEVLEETSENFFGNKENRSKEISTNSSTTEVLEETSENLFGNQENRSPKEISTNSSTAEILEETSENFFGNEVNRSPKETSKNSSTAEVLEETSENLFGKQENRSPEEISTNSSTTEVLEETSDDFLGNEENRSPKEISTNSSIAEVLEETSENPFNMATSQIRVLTLNNQEHQECTIYRIEKNWALQFRLGPSLFGRKVYLYCNYPVEKQGKLEEFQRDQYQLLTWVWDEGCKNADDTAAYTQIAAKLAGSFHYYFTFEKGHDAERQGSGFFLVDPVLKYGNDEDLPLDCIQCQTVLAKSLGSFSSWEQKLQVAKESGYNMIHFTPIQELGVSNSCYSLSEQLKLNPLFKKENGEMPKFEEIKQFASTMRKDWKVTSICDIVLNHTANESEWIKIHPEVTYNCVICPYMRPAYLLDAAFHQFSMDVKKGLYEDKGIPVEVSTEEHLNAIRYHFRSSVLEPLKIYELYICDTSKLAAEFFSLARNTPPVTRNGNTELPELRVLQDEEFRRLSSTVDLSLALKLYNVYRNDTFDEDSRLKRCTEDFKSKLDSLNSSIVEEINDHLTCAVENVLAGIRYFRVQPDGPRVKEITVKNPLVYRYFTDYGTPKSIKEHEAIMYSENGRFLMAHNGWVMNSDPLKNFAAPDSNVYIRRELIAWGDSVKLRYGNKPEDCPFLWEHMKKYVEQTAEIFDGVRLDNCHSTPIPVAEYLLDCARRVRPNLYVVAELFTNSDMTDNIFVNRLGITSLIREAMSAWDSHEEGRLVYRYGGSPVGSFYQPRVRPLVPSVAHALFLDLTHDNPSPVEKRSVFDLLPSTALVNMACCASGSNRGYDELVPHHIHVVDETRQYTEWTSDEDLARDNLRYVTKKSGIISAKRALNDIHFTLGKEGYNQVYVDQMDPDIVAVTRHRPDTHESYILVAFTAFGHPSEDSANYQRGIRPLRFEGTLDEIVVETSLSHVSTKSGGSKFARWEKFVKDSKWVNGLSEYEVTVKQHIQASESDIFDKVDSGTANVTQLNFKNFKPGSVVVIKASLPETMRDAIKTVRALMDQFSLTKETELSRIIDNMTLADLNRTLYRCDQEERDEGFGYDTYHIPNFGSLVYAGLQGFISPLANIRLNNDLGHPLCANLRDGNWMIEYIWKRLKLDDGTKHLGQWIEENTKCFNNIPRYLVPSYFDVIVTGLYLLLLEQSYKLMSKFVNHGSTFVRGLSMGSVQFAAYIKSADLPTLSPNLAPPKPPTRKNDKGEIVQTCLTLSAGLPHFSVGYTRNWGRDTFIALRGLFILTGRFEEARQHILGYGACLRHGLIPNLLDGGRNSRFNCRDAVWWWLYCIKEYVEGSPNGINILSDQVSRIFPTDASPAQPAGVVDQPLYDVMQEALKVHFQGLAFRERNAGRQIDAHMTDRGFNNQIGVHPETGFVFGGNEWNCGTWMDKMGSSDKAGNRGKPATPRDGSAIELIGLSKAVITWLWKLNQENKYPYNGVQRLHTNGSFTKWTFKEWSDKIQANFEKYYWVNSAPVPGEYRSDLINKRGIYKDTYGATQPWSDFQLRCNFPIAMVVAPELFNPQHAWIALKQAEKYLLGPLGMKTLDPEDWAYRGDYDNSNDSNDPSVAHGFNYHQGPEWVWPVGFFLRAKLHFASQNGALTETVASTKVVLSKHFTELQTSVWRGLPELTNSNGSYCRDSSRTQAWSMSCILEVLHDLQKIESKQPVLIN